MGNPDQHGVPTGWKTLQWVVLVLALLVVQAAAVSANQFHVTTSGTSTGTGSTSRPWDLQTALNRPSSVQPGDTIWVHGGTYKGIFTSRLNGTSSLPIIVRNWNNERATIDGGNSDGKVIFTVYSTYTWFWGLEVMSSETNKIATIPVENNSWPVDIMYGEGVIIDQNGTNGTGCKFINLVVHDTRQGFSSWQDAVGAEVYGCVMYDNGWQGPDQTHGHNIYVQNLDGTKLFSDNYVLRAYSHGIQAYGSDAAYLNNLQFVSNVEANSVGRGFLLGCGNPALNPLFKDNVLYRDEPSTGTTLFFMNYGTNAGTRNAVVTGNYFIGGGLTFNANTNLTFTGNTLYNTTVGGEVPSMAGNNVLSTKPSTNTVLFRKNIYDLKRANITVLNWVGSDYVDVDVSSVLRSGDTYEVRDAQNYFGTPVLSGSYTGQLLHLPMVGLSVPAKVGNDPRSVSHTLKDLGTFVLIGTGSAQAPVSGSLSASPANLPPGGGTVTLTWTSQNATSASIDQGVGTVAVSGSMTVNVTESKTFTLTLYGPNGPVTSQASVVVAPWPVTGSLTASPTSLPAGGGTVTLTWTSQHATSASIDQGIGSVAINGLLAVQVTESKTFTLTLTGPNGPITSQASVEVAPWPVSGSITASPTSLPAGGGNVTLTWSSQHATSASIDQGIGTVATSGSRIVAVTESETFTLTLNGPGGSVSSQASVEVAPWPVSGSLSASPMSLPAGGGTVTLTWTSQHATSASIDQGIGTVATSGSRTVQVTESKVFTLTLNGVGGPVTSQASVQVAAPQPVVSGSLTASPTSLPAGGGTVTLTWSSHNATSASIDQGIGTVATSGSRDVQVTESKVFTLTLNGNGGPVTSQASVQVAVTQPVVSGSLNASPMSLPAGGGTVTLTWTSQNATSASIDQGIGTVATSGSRSVQVTESKIFTLTLNGTGGPVTSQASVQVAVAQPVVSGSLSVSPTSLPAGGGSVTLTWSSQNATSASIDQGIGTVATSGSRSVQVTESKIFTLTLNGTGGPVTSQASVQVAEPPVSGSLTASPTSLPAGGGTVTLTWTSQNATSASIDQGIGTVATSGSRTVQVTESKTFTLTLNGTGGPVTSQASVQVAAATLTAVTLISPANGAIELKTSPDLIWNPVTNATSYEIQVSTDVTFGTLVFSNSAVSTTQQQIPELALATTYFWRVRAKNAAFVGSFSPTWQFSTTITRVEAMYPITLLGIPIESRTRTFTANKPADVDSAYVLMWVYDADGQSEGAMRVNGADSLVLFGAIGTPARDEVLSSFTLRMSAAGWKDGANTLVFVHYATAGFRIDSIAVSFVKTGEDTTPRGPVPLMYDLGANFPNPFNPQTTIPYDVWTGAHVTITVYDLLGQKIATLVDGIKAAGSYEVQFNASGLSSGVYFYQLSTGDGYLQRRKMMVLK
jgi:hypothetical protein